MKQLVMKTGSSCCTGGQNQSLFLVFVTCQQWVAGYTAAVFSLQNGFPDADADSHIRELLQEAQLSDAAEGPSEMGTSARIGEVGSSEAVDVSFILSVCARLEGAHHHSLNVDKVNFCRCFRHDEDQSIYTPRHKNILQRKESSF